MQILDVPTLAAQFERFLGQKVLVRGYFALAAEEGYLVAHPEARENTSAAIHINVPNLKQKALQSIPPLGGGTYYYLHQATVIGRVAPSIPGSYACSLVEVSELVASLSGEEFSIHFEGEAP